MRSAVAGLTSGVDWDGRWFIDYLHRLRRFELQEIVKSIPAGARILEIGGGTGYQAHLLAQRGWSVVSVDLPTSCHARGKRFANVMQYDGHRLPFAGASFDVALSSYVMSCVEDSGALQRELTRVLRPDGFAVHVVPTHFWHLWRLVFYHLFLAKTVAERLAQRGSAPACAAGPTANHAPAELLQRCLAPKRIGVRGNAFTEPWFTRPNWWRGHFERNGWIVVEERPVTLYHTGYRLLGSRLPLSTRRRLAHLLGPSGRLFKVLPSGAGSHRRPGRTAAT